VHIHIGPNGEEIKSPKEPEHKKKKADELRHSNELNSSLVLNQQNAIDKEMGDYLNS
jgi:hypothetical protein